MVMANDLRTFFEAETPEERDAACLWIIVEDAAESYLQLHRVAEVAAMFGFDGLFDAISQSVHVFFDYCASVGLDDQEEIDKLKKGWEQRRPGTPWLYGGCSS